MMCEDGSESVRGSNTDAASTKARHGSPEPVPSTPDSHAPPTHDDDDRHFTGASVTVESDRSTPVDRAGLYLPDMLHMSAATPRHPGDKRHRDKLECDLDDQLEEARARGSSKRARRDSERSVSDSVGPEEPSSPSTGPDDDDDGKDQARRGSSAGHRQGSTRASNGSRR